MEVRSSKRERFLSLLKRKSTSNAAESTGNLCQKCLSLFSRVDSLDSLVSPQGLEFKTWKSIQVSTDHGCRLCGMILRYGSISPQFRQTTFPFSLHAEYYDEAQVSDQDGYPARILAIKNIWLWHRTLGSSIPSFLTLYTIPGTRTANHLICPPFPYDLSDERNVQEALRKLEVCYSSHKLCGKIYLTQLPSRVIDVQSSMDSKVVQIHLSKPGEVGRYTALSYCWGKVPQRMSTIRSIGGLAEGLPLESLSKSVQDAVQVTRALRIQYLWVDALCIIQDSPGDVAHEIGSMGSIYRNATLTIVAAASDSAHLGFLDTNAPYDGCELPFILPDGTSDTILAVPGGIGPRIPPLPLDTRGWSMQEQMLSARQLIFNLHGIGWKCQTDDFAPLFSTPFDKFTSIVDYEVPRLPSSVFTGELSAATDSHAEQQILWEKVIQEYCKRKLTYFEDRLPALAGIAALLQDLWNDTYVAGLWISCLVAHLSWQVIPTSINSLSSGKLPYVAPSWSWISIPTEIRFCPLATMTATVYGFLIEPQDRNAPLGKIKSGYVNLLTKANSQSVKTRFPDLDRERNYLDTGSKEKMTPDVIYLKLGTLGMNAASGLLVKPVGDGTYRRVGMFEARENELFDDVPNMIYRLV